MTVYTTIQPAD